MESILNNFKIVGNIKEYKSYGEGHINDTYLVSTDMNQYILQKINTDIFIDYESLTENILNVTSFLKNKIEKQNGDVERETLTLIQTSNGKYFYEDNNGNVWRMYRFIKDTYCINMLKDENDFYRSAVAFGNFQKMLNDFPIHKLNETIKDFHNTPNRFFQFKIALNSDEFNRAKDIREEIDFVLKRENHCNYLIDKLSKAEISLKVTHNDTKLNNILFDKKTNNAICIIDLDTVMPGLVAYDFGDAIRFGANHCKEDEKDLIKVNFDKHLYDVYLEGFLKGLNNTLTENEIKSLPYGAYLMTLECGIRFLTDYLNGDVYFKTDYPKQNLYRARTQFKLAYQMNIELELFNN